MDAQELLSIGKDALTVKRAFGEAYQQDGVTVIPVALVAGGGGGGQGQGEGQGSGTGGGFGLGVRPLGVYLIKDGDVAWRPAVDVNRIILGGQIVGLMMVLTLRTWLKRRHR